LAFQKNLSFSVKIIKSLWQKNNGFIFLYLINSNEQSNMQQKRHGNNIEAFILFWALVYLSKYTFWNMFWKVIVPIIILILPHSFFIFIISHIIQKLKFLMFLHMDLHRQLIKQDFLRSLRFYFFIELPILVTMRQFLQRLLR